MTEYRRGRGPHFAPIPFELLEDPEIDAYAIATYAVLKSYADFGSSGGARPSDAQAAKLAGCGDRTFRARRELLCEKGWVEWETRAGRTNLYVVHSSPEPDTSAPRAEVEAADLGTTCRPPRHHMPTT